MKILFIGTDTKLFEPHSSVHERFLGFSSLGEEIHMVVARPSRYRGVYKMSKNIFIHGASVSSRFFALIKSFFVGYNILKKDSISDWVISVQDPFEQGFVGWLLSKIFHIPLHVQVHTDMLSPFFIQHSFVNRMRVFFAGFILRSARRIRVDAARIKDSLVQKYNIPGRIIDTLQIYIDVPRMMSSESVRYVEGDYILYVGRFEKEKNVESIIRGFAKVAESLPQLKIVLLGSGGLLPSYKELAKKLGVQDKLVIVPWSNDVGGYMRHAKGLILASWFEGFALVLIEAILNDCPIITTDVGAVGGIIPKEHVHIFPQNDSVALSEKITYVALHEEQEKQKVQGLKTIVLSRIPKDLDSYAVLFKESLEKALG